MTTSHIIEGLVFLLLPLGLFARNVWVGYRNPLPAEPPQRHQDASADGEWLLFPFQLIAGLAGLCWMLIMLAVFLAPLAFVALALLAVLR